MQLSPTDVWFSDDEPEVKQINVVADQKVYLGAGLISC